MKKILLSAVVVLVFTCIAIAGAVKPAIITTLNSSTYTEIINTGGSCGSFVAFATDNSDFVSFYYATDSAGSNAVFVSESSLGFYIKVNRGDTVFFVKAVTGTPSFIFQPMD